MQTVNDTTPPTLADVSALKNRVAQLGRETTADMSNISEAILTLAHTTPTDDPDAMYAALISIAALGVEFAEAWQDMIRLSQADHLVDLCEAALAGKVS